MIYLYAMAEPSDQPIDIAALAEQPVGCHREAGLCAIFSEHDGPPIPTTPDNIWRHEQVIERLMRDRTVLPSRFGTVFASIDSLSDSLVSHGVQLLEGLEHVRGCVELGVRAICRAPAEGPDLTSNSGTQYMRQRARQERERAERLSRASELSDAIHSSLSEHAVQSTRKELDDSPFVLSAAYLVRQDVNEQFRMKVQDLAIAHSSVRILCTGPWPPYHFVPRLRPAEVCHA